MGISKSSTQIPNTLTRLEPLQLALFGEQDKTNGLMAGRVSGAMGGCVGGRVARWMGRWVDGWVDGRAGGWGVWGGVEWRPD